MPFACMVHLHPLINNSQKADINEGFMSKMKHSSDWIHSIFRLNQDRITKQGLVFKKPRSCPGPRAYWG